MVQVAGLRFKVAGSGDFGIPVEPVTRILQHETVPIEEKSAESEMGILNELFPLRLG
ncbi:MAG: hypothetical protein JJU46_13635 [Balneolaceae bacterium]|nr:hypothetical protein [Balneolaceae bacterium]MCH8550072.1 hypothetical protein [Balneolaceae bacterium]